MKNINININTIEGIKYIEIDNIPSSYGTTTAAGTVEQALRLKFLSCGDGNDFKIDKETFYKIKDMSEMVIIEEPFKGGIVSVLQWDGIVQFTDGLTFEQYQENKKGRELKLITWDEYFKIDGGYWRSPFKEITREEWEEMLCVLPPENWHDIDGEWNVFFMSEYSSGIYTGTYLRNRKTEKYYSATKSGFSSDAELLTDIEKEIV